MQRASTASEDFANLNFFWLQEDAPKEVESFLELFPNRSRAVNLDPFVTRMYFSK
ncbi:MAG: hypothetical protein WAK31_06815 [Chthoniobacterales bacterium]